MPRRVNLAARFERELKADYRYHSQRLEQERAEDEALLEQERVEARDASDARHRTVIEMALAALTESTDKLVAQISR